MLIFYNMAQKEYLLKPCLSNVKLIDIVRVVGKAQYYPRSHLLWDPWTELEKGSPADALDEVVVWVVWQPGPGGNLEADHPGSGEYVVIAPSYTEHLLS